MEREKRESIWEPRERERRGRGEGLEGRRPHLPRQPPPLSVMKPVATIRASMVAAELAPWLRMSLPLRRKRCARGEGRGSLSSKLPSSPCRAAAISSSRVAAAAHVMSLPLGPSPSRLVAGRRRRDLCRRRAKRRREKEPVGEELVTAASAAGENLCRH
ncbi:uncharacterized protein DS421_15g511000 [Arachis hypogaea]|nr:uncharacterized protein DS421_15g511000 [Arachis hypogaea]